MPDYAVNTTFTAKDRVSPAFKKMGKSADRFGRRTSSAFRNASKEGFRFNTIVKGIVAANVIRGGVGQVTAGLGKAISEFIRFDDVMIGAAAKFDDIDISASNFQQRTEDISKSAREMARTTRFNVGEVGLAMESMAQKGLDSAEALGSLSTMMNLAAATGEDLSDATSKSIDLLGAFDLKGKSREERLKNQIRLNDVLTKSIISSNVTLEDLFETLKTIGPVSVNLGQEFEATMAMVTVLGDAGIKQTLAATALKNAFIRIPSKRLAADFEAEGIKLIDQDTGKMRRMSDIIGDIAKSTERLGPVAKSQVFEKIFGLRAIAGAGNIMRNLAEIERRREELLAAGGTAAKVSAAREKSLMSRVLKLGSAFLELAFQVQEAFSGKGRRGLEAFTDSVNRFNVKPIIESIGLFVKVMGALWLVSWPFRQLMPELIGAFIAFKGALAIGAIWSYIAAFVALTRAHGIATAAVWAFNVAMAANPLMWIPLAIAAGVAALIFLERKFGILSKTLEVLKKSFLALWRGAKAFFGIFTGGGVPELKFPDTTGITEAIKSQREALAPNARREAPNAKDAAARNATFKGTLDITGAPDGSRLTTSSVNAPGFDASLLGAAP